MFAKPGNVRIIKKKQLAWVQIYIIYFTKNRFNRNKR